MFSLGIGIGTADWFEEAVEKLDLDTDPDFQRQSQGSLAEIGFY